MSALPEVQTKPRLALVDGSGYIFRAYHALPPLTRKDGTPVGAVYGFTNMLLKLQQQLKADYLAVIFDAGRDTFRNEIYADYKANRDETPEDLKPQFAIVREATDAMNIPRIEMDAYEADDIIASYAAQLGGACEVMIVSSDKDLMQLINEDVYLYDPMKQREMREEAVMEKFGVTPDLVTHVQALIGDSVDNVPGVPGIGPKTAALLIDEYGTLEGVLENAPSIKQNKRRESLIEHAANARMSFELVTLKGDLPLPLPLQELELRKPAPETLLSFLQLNGFSSLLKKKEAEFGQAAPAMLASEEEEAAAVASTVSFDEAQYELVTDMSALEAWIAEARAVGHVAIDTETTSLNAMQAELVGISLCVHEGKACYLPLAHVNERQAAGGGQGSLFGGDEATGGATEWTRAEGQLERDAVLEALRPLLLDPAVLKIGQNIKYDLLVLKQHGVDVSPVDDSMLLSYVGTSGLHGHGMDELSQLLLNHKPIAFKEVVGSGKSQKLFSQVPPEEAGNYAAEDADITLRLATRLKQTLVQKKLLSVYEDIERPLIDVIVQMEANGIKAAPEKLKAMSVEFAGKLEVLEREIHALAGREFNVGSPKQLGEILFDEMAIEGGKKGKTGAYATGAEKLEELAAEGHDIATKVLEWRGLSKLKSTYTDALQKQIHPQTGRVHTSFSMAAANTGRLASSDPNLQNIPVRSEDGRRIREAFIAEEGNKLISADYSQIELRLLAHVAGIDVLKDAFKHGRDIHAATASQMFGVPLDEVDGELRRKAKTINFGIIYGISAHGLAQRLGIGRPEAAEYINAYFEQYPGIRRYMEAAKEEAREHGYITTLYGRRVHFKNMKAKNPNLRAFSERAAINAPLQGTAADIIKRAMVRVYRALAAEFPKAKLLLQVHDELIVEAPEAQAQAVAELIKREMAAAAYLSVPLLVEAGIGEHWGEIH